MAKIKRCIGLKGKKHLNDCIIYFNCVLDIGMSITCYLHKLTFSTAHLTFVEISSIINIDGFENWAK